MNEHYKENTDHEEHDKHRVANKLATRITDSAFTCSDDLLKHSKGIDLQPDDWIAAIEIVIEQQGGFVGNTQFSYERYIAQKLMALTQYCDGDTGAVQDVLDAERGRLAHIAGADTVDFDAIAGAVWEHATGQQGPQTKHYKLDKASDAAL